MSYSQELIDIYKLDGIHKKFYISIGDVFPFNFDNSTIVDESIELKQSIFEGSSLDICGCVASSLTFKLRADIRFDIEYIKWWSKGMKVTFDVQAGDTQVIRLFTGKIDSSDIEANKKFITITAYDDLYRLSGQAGISNAGSGGTADENFYNISDWFNSHIPCTIYQLLGDLCSKYDIQMNPLLPSLVNGSMTTYCGQRHKVSGISALDLLKDICRINGCFGYINGYGYFDVLYLKSSPFDEIGQLYPSDFLYPGDTLNPGINSEQSAANSDNFLGEYESLSYQGFTTFQIDTVKVADYEDDKEAGYARDDLFSSNRYFIYGNLCMLKQNKSAKETAARRILDTIRSVYYTPFQARGIGLPYISLGDEVAFYDYAKNKYFRFYILTRTLKCAQHMTDEYSADGDEYLHEFTVGSSKDTHDEPSQDIQELEDRVTQNEDDILNMSGNITNIEGDIDDIQTDYSNLNTDYSNYKTATNAAISDLQQGFQVNLKIVSEVPANPDRNTLYLIKGDTMIL